MNKQYSIGQLVNILNQQLELQFQFQLDIINSTPANPSQIGEFLGFSNSITHDTNIIPKWYDFQLKTAEDVKRISNIIHWINTKLFENILKQLCNNRYPLQTTSFVRLRIAVNLIEKLNIPQSRKIEWIEHLQTCYRNRQQAIAKFYDREIAEIPF